MSGQMSKSGRQPHVRPLPYPGNMNDNDKAILDFAARTYRYPGAQAEAITTELDMRPTRYWQRLNHLLDDPQALAYAPTTVNRYRRLRDRAHRSQRSIII